MTSLDHISFSPDTNPAHGLEYIERLPAPMQIDAIDKMRDEQSDYVEKIVQDAQAAKGAPLDDMEEQQVRNDAVGDFDAKIKERLISNGIAEDDPRFTSYALTLRAMSLDKISHTEWNEREVDPDDNSLFLPSKRMIAVEGLQAVAETLPDPEEPTRDEENEAEKQEKQRRIDEARAAVEETRERHAAMSAKRQGRFFKRKGQKHEEARAAYQEKVSELGRLELADKLADDTLSDEDKNAAVIQFLFEEQGQLRQLTTEKLQGTKVSKFINWMNKGRVATRILKGMFIGGAAGLGGSLLAGAAGASLITAGVVGATRFARGFALRDKDRRGMRNVADAIDQDTVMEATSTRESEDRFNKASEHFGKIFEDDTKREQSKRRKAVIWGVGSLAVGAALGHGLHLAAERLSHHSFQLWRPFGADHHSAASGSGSEDSVSQIESDYSSRLDAARHLGDYGSLPSSEGYEHPWTWARDVIASHDITTHETPEAWLHELGDRAREAGHKVEWFGGGKHEWVRIDGTKEDAAALDVLRQFAKK